MRLSSMSVTAIEVAASGKVNDALAASRRLLEFKADPDLPTHDPALRKDRPVILVLRFRWPGRSRWEDAARYGFHRCTQRWRLQGFGRGRLGGRGAVTAHFEHRCHRNLSCRVRARLPTASFVAEGYRQAKLGALDLDRIKPTKADQIQTMPRLILNQEPMTDVGFD
jgi:hypothetical protein